MSKLCRLADEVLTWATWRNTGGGKFVKVSDMSTKLFCNPRGVFWVDLNGASPLESQSKKLTTHHPL